MRWRVDDVVTLLVDDVENTFIRQQSDGDTFASSFSSRDLTVDWRRATLNGCRVSGTNSAPFRPRPVFRRAPRGCALVAYKIRRGAFLQTFRRRFCWDFAAY
jgi:hypothetical protein